MRHSVSNVHSKTKRHPSPYKREPLLNVNKMYHHVKVYKKCLGGWNDNCSKIQTEKFKICICLVQGRSDTKTENRGEESHTSLERTELAQYGMLSATEKHKRKRLD